MKFIVTAEQRDYFRKNGFIPFDELLSSEELKQLNLGILEALPSGHSDPFLQGRDLFRFSDKIRKIVLSKRLSELAFEILQKKPLRLAFDQFLPKITTGERAFYPDTPFDELSCINDLAGAYLIVISADEKEQMTPGSGFFFLPSAPFPFSSLPVSGQFFLIGYGGVYSQYLHKISDPHVHYLKTLGYVFGDRLNDKFHPLLLR